MKNKYTCMIGALILVLSIIGCKSNKKENLVDGSKKQSSYLLHLAPQTKNDIGTTTHSKHSSNVTYNIVDYASLPEWSNQYFEQSLSAFKRGCVVLIKQPKWHDVCQIATQINNTRKNARHFFEQYFQPWVITNNHGGLAGKITGYYEPVITGSKTKSSKSVYPIYSIPDDFVSIPLPQNLINHKGIIKIKKTGNNNSALISTSGTYFANLSKFNIRPDTKILKGRFSGNKFIPYYTRREIDQGIIRNTAPILAYADNPVELFFLHVQGSGRIMTRSGQIIRLAYADKNEWPYQSISMYMAQKGYIPINSASVQNIKQYIQHHPNQQDEILSYNPSFIFFNIADTTEHEGPIGTLGVPLTQGYSGAIDRHYITLGAPIFLATTDPRNGKAFNRLIMAQDTGSAINGSVRVDLFWGSGNQAGQTANKTNHLGYVWILLPNGQYPL